MKYNKLVRDKIPEIIKQENRKVVTHTADNMEYWEKLKEKLKEEVEEFMVSESEEEIADVLEVIDAICKYKEFNKDKISSIQKVKTRRRGGFKKRIILGYTK